MLELKIEGATCNGCVNSIEKAIQQVSGVESVSFSLDTKTAVVQGTAEFNEVALAVENAGFDVIDEH